MSEAAFACPPYSYAEARRLADELRVSDPLAITLVRRGYRTAEDARRFLEASEEHEPSLFEGMAEAVGLLSAALRAGRRITVHGDFDVDGVCATAVMVSTLRRLGGDCDWFIPGRMEDGYGLREDNVRRLAERGTNVLLTVDCGITAAAEVALARGLGMQVIVTDHHHPGEALPDCLTLHPRLGGYPFAELCGTGVAWKLAAALSQDPGASEADLDLVALATVADLVPLVGENRNLVRRGLAVARRARRPGLRALMAAAAVEPERLDEGDFAFRLGPRINAAGRLYRADAGVELMLTTDDQRAAAIAAELNRANSERRAAEREVDQAAEAALRALPDQLRDAPAIVVAGRDWHPGVIGIVASRLVERHWRPAVVISLDGDGSGRGSGRGVPGFDLLAALDECARHLVRHGGHRAAAGLEIREDRIEEFHEALVAAASRQLDGAAAVRTEPIDAVVGGRGLGLDLAEELARLAPFGAGNPGVRLLVPSARLGDVRPMGEEGKHSRFSLQSGAYRALGVAFGRSALPDGAEVDAAVRLEINHWNGAVEPRLVLRELFPVDGDPGRATHPAHCTCPDEEWWRRLEAELAAPLDPPPLPTVGRKTQTGFEEFSPRVRVEGGGSVAATLAELVSSGESVLAVCADASRRAQIAAGAAGLARFGGAAAAVACARCATAMIAAALESEAGLVLTDHAALALAPGAARRFTHVVLVDPPAGPAELAAVAAGPDGTAGYLHLAWGAAETGFALEVLGEQLGLRAPLAATFRALREDGESSGPELRALLCGDGAHGLAPEVAGRCLRVLLELGLVRRRAEPVAEGLVVVSSERTKLESSDAFRAYAKRHQEAREFLARPTPA